MGKWDGDEPRERKVLVTSTGDRGARRMVPRHEELGLRDPSRDWHEAPSPQGKTPAPRAAGSLIAFGDFPAHTVASLPWKIECDCLGRHDWDQIARVVHRKIPTFSEVLGVPRGGLAFAEALKPMAGAHGPVLIVDDVLTTGRSMEEFRDAVMRNRTPAAIGVVLFARAPCRSWILPIFELSPWLRS